MCFYPAMSNGLQMLGQTHSAAGKWRQSNEEPQVCGIPPLQSKTAAQSRVSWVTTGPVLAFNVSTMSADIASRGGRIGLYREGWRSLAEDCGRSNQATS